MQTRIQKEFVDTGFGFPIRLMNVPMVKVRGAWTPKLNYNELALAVLRALSQKAARLTGSEVRFIRNHLELTLQEFAGRFCVTHVAVMKWERAKSHPTAMAWATEKDIRLFILSKLTARSDEWVELYARLERLPEGKAAPIQLNARQVAA